MKSSMVQNLSICWTAALSIFLQNLYDLMGRAFYGSPHLLKSGGGGGGGAGLVRQPSLFTLQLWNALPRKASLTSSSRLFRGWILMCRVHFIEFFFNCRFYGFNYVLFLLCDCVPPAGCRKEAYKWLK